MLIRPTMEYAQQIIIYDEEVLMQFEKFQFVVLKICLHNKNISYEAAQLIANTSSIKNRFAKLAFGFVEKHNKRIGSNTFNILNNVNKNSYTTQLIDKANLYKSKWQQELINNLRAKGRCPILTYLFNREDFAYNSFFWWLKDYPQSIKLIGRSSLITWMSQLSDNKVMTNVETKLINNLLITGNNLSNSIKDTIIDWNALPRDKKNRLTLDILRLEQKNPETIDIRRFNSVVKLIRSTFNI